MLTLTLFYAKNPNVLCRTDDSTEAEFVQYTTTLLKVHAGKFSK